MKVMFYEMASGRSPIKDFFSECSLGVRKDFFDAVNLLEQGKKLTMPLNRPLANIRLGLSELRLKDRYGQYRFLYFIKKGEAIYLLHAFKKKTEELPKKEENVVLKRLREV